ncbi:MAG: DUF4157 domain-containing protein [Nitrospirota bacterium]|nr:DUF4157 domain-containing protein [Nitrospirota bacterium]
MLTAAVATTRVPEATPKQRFVSSPASYADDLAVNISAVGLPLFLQPKPAISQPNDPAEQEADRVADQVMRMADPALAERSIDSTMNHTSSIQRLCQGCEDEEALQRQTIPSMPKPLSSDRDAVSATLRQGGQPLDPNTREFFEPRFGTDFSAVRIHTDAQAVESARSVNALAYTVGRDVVFNNSQYAPHSDSGRRLLAHELTHVVQGGGLGLIARQVREGPTTTIPEWHPGVAHGHTPTGRWTDVQADAAASCAAITGSMGMFGPTVGGAVDASIACACASMSPADVLAVARNTVLSSSPLGQAHLDHYLAGGGVNLAEDLADVIRRDSGVRSVLAMAITSSLTGYVTITQPDYAEEDFQNAFGAIDRMDYAVDTAAGTVQVWFQDRYEWHPAGYGYSLFPGDGVRGTNCVHAAAVEMQSLGATDYWMFGNATVPLSLITGARGTGSAPGTAL